MVFLDLYNNRISSVTLGSMKSMRILGLQNNRISRLDPRGLPACQGIDAGKNRLTELDVSQNPELVELYINDNDFRQIDISHNPKLKYFYCHNNGITALDTTCNPLLRHLNATNNPLREIRSLAPQQKERLPLSLTAADGGYVGLQFNPVYNAQWKETGEWQQSYYAYPNATAFFSTAGMMKTGTGSLTETSGWTHTVRAGCSPRRSDPCRSGRRTPE
jgi:Leucine-rich repeat (LRR) protein